MDTMTIFKDGQVFRELPLEAHVTIGRHPDMKVQLEDPLLSRTHAEVVREGSEYFLRDMRSSNGTFLNGQKIEAGAAVRVKAGDVAQVGPFVIRFQITAGPAQATTQVFQSDPLAGVAAAPAPPPPPSPLLQHLVDTRHAIPIWQGGETVLKVADIIDETHDVKTFRMIGIEPILFSYKPGQFVTLNLEIDGKKVLRSYSLSSSPSRPHTLEVTVKRVPGGQVSNWLADNVKLGDTIRLKGPSGKFSCFEYPARKILFIAAGSGITPLMSMCRWIVDTTADVDVKFFVSARSPHDIIFRKELELMSARHSGFEGIVTVTSGGGGTESWLGFTGRCTAKMLEMVAPDFMERHAFMCGPEPFMDAAKDVLRTMEFPLANLHTESFGGGRVAAGTDVKPRDVPVRPSVTSAPPVPATVPRPESAAPAPAIRPLPPAAPAPAAAPAYEVSFAVSGKTVRTDGRSALLDLAEANGIEIDYACRTGSCGTCKAMCKSGSVEMEDDSGLSEDEKKAGYVLTCVGSPRSSVVLEA